MNANTEAETSRAEVPESKLYESIRNLTMDLAPYFHSLFLEMATANPKNAEFLCSFLSFECNNSNIKTSTKQTHIKIISWFDRFLAHKDFSKVTRENLVAYFASIKKGEQADPTHKWIGTHNTRHMIVSKFFKWLYNQNEFDQNKWIVPPCFQGIRPLPRKERSSYKPSDIWTNEEHAIFLKYCPEERDRCYHAMANDTSARPHELLSLKIKDILFKRSSTGLQYAEVHIANTKTKPRTVPLIFSIPYVKDWVESHPMGSNPNAFLFISLADSNFGEQLAENALYKVYTRSYKERYFRKLLKNPAIAEGEKSHIRNLLTKPWCPYILRHSALTHKSQILRESTLREHAGWSMTSRMPSVYIHYFGNESSRSLLEAFGIENYNQEQRNIIQSTICPNCHESCRREARFCAVCKMVLKYDAYNEALEDEKSKEIEMSRMKEQIAVMEESQKEIVDFLRDPAKLIRLLNNEKEQ